MSVDPRVARHPGMFKLLKLLRASTKIMLIAFVPLLILMTEMRQNSVYVFWGWLAILAAIAAARIGISLVFFVRFSLWTMYLVVLSLGGFLAVGIGFPGWGPVLAVQGIGVILFLTLICVAIYEPTEGKITDPEYKYVPRTKEEQRAARWTPPE